MADYIIGRLISIRYNHPRRAIVPGSYRAAGLDRVNKNREEVKKMSVVLKFFVVVGVMTCVILVVVGIPWLLLQSKTNRNR
jgi:hypothetical protein